MMYEMKNLFLPSEQGERTECFLTVALIVTSKRRDGHVPAVTSADVRGEHVWAHRQTPVSPGIPPPPHALPEPKEYVAERNAASDPAVCPLGTAAAWVLIGCQDHPSGATGVRGLVCVMQSQLVICRPAAALHSLDKLTPICKLKHPALGQALWRTK